MRADNNDAVFAAGEFGNDVRHRHLAGGCFGDKSIFFHLAAFELALDISAYFVDGGAAVSARAEGDNLFGVLHGAARVDAQGGAYGLYWLCSRSRGRRGRCAAGSLGGRGLFFGFIAAQQDRGGKKYQPYTAS